MSNVRLSAGLRSTRRLVTALTVATMFVVPAIAPSVAAAAHAPIAIPFRTPSGQIGCFYTTGPTFLRCDATFRTRFSGRRCREGIYGPAFGMYESGRSRALCVSDSAIEPRAPVLDYGKTRVLGPYVCTSRRSGLTCRNRAGHGWTLSRRQQKLF